jgi:phosphoglycolate phosphatase-like HAD superfamily hydrolase
MSKVIIFDFDGTLADSMMLMVESYNRAAKTYGCTLIDQRDLVQLRSMHLRDILYLLKIPYLKLPFVLYSSLSYYKTEILSVKVFPGIPEMLCSLKVMGYDLYIVSTNNTDTIAHFLKEHGLDFFKGIYSCGSNMFGKDSVIKSVCKKEKIIPSKAFYVGDELRDVDAGHQAGTRVMAVSWGYNSRETLVKQKADVVVDTPLELVDFFRAYV